MFDPKKIFESDEIYNQIEATCRRKFYNENERMECSTYIMDYLKKDNYKKLRAYKGNSSVKTYLYTVLNRLAIDCRIKKYGKRIFPKAIEKLDDWGKLLFRISCWEGYTFDQAYDVLCINYKYEGSFIEYQELEKLVRKAPCKKIAEFVSNEDPSGNTIDYESDETSQLELIIRKQDAEKRKKAIEIMKKHVNSLNDENKNIYKLILKGRKKATEVARLHKLNPATVRNRVKKINLQIREKLLAEGIR